MAQREQDSARVASLRFIRELRDDVRALDEADSVCNDTEGDAVAEEGVGEEMDDAEVRHGRLKWSSLRMTCR